MLAFLVAKVHLGRVVPVWDHGTVLLLLGGVALSALGILLSAVRWHRVLAALEQPSRLRPLLSAYLAGQFVSNFLPSTIGGDALRISRLSAAGRGDVATPETGPIPETGPGLRTAVVAGPGPTSGAVPAAFASVVLDRMSGWLILPLLCLVGLAINPSLLHLGRSSRAAVSLSLVTLGALALVVAVASSPRLGRRLVGHEGWRRCVGAVHLGLTRLRRRPAAAAQVVAASVLYQLAMVTACLLAAHALGIRIGPTALLAFVPAVAIVQVLPVTVGGLGVREGAFALFLAPLGVPTARAVALGLALYAMHLLASLLGAPAFAVGSRQRGVPAPLST